MQTVTIRVEVFMENEIKTAQGKAEIREVLDQVNLQVLESVGRVYTPWPADKSGDGDVTIRGGVIRDSNADPIGDWSVTEEVA